MHNKQAKTDANRIEKEFLIMTEAEKKFEERKLRVETAVANKQPDRVPNVLRIGSFPVFQAGISPARAMWDFEGVNKAMLDFYAGTDSLDIAAGSGTSQASKVLENLDVKTARWPGDPKGLPEDNTYQFVEFPTLLEDEYDELFDHPAEFFFTKHMPRTLGIAEPLADIDWFAMVTRGGSGWLTSPDKIPVYEKLLEACQENVRKNKASAEFNKAIEALGYYNMNGGGSATAFDMLGDTLRGTFGMMPDMILQRDNVVKALERFCELHIQSTVGMCKAAGWKYGWVMLHKGFDNFISDEDYAELYWPYLQKWILALIDNGITPVVYTEGSYNTRLKYLKDVPTGKVVYHFEEVDLALAKKELGDVACIQGGFPAYVVNYGTPAQIDEEVKKTLDIMAPGGGYLFTTGYSLGNCPKENIEAVLEAMDKYGKY